MAVKVISICGRAPNGLSRPFICEGDDGNFYFLKSGNVTHGERVKEYLVSRLAEEFGLPVAPIELVSLGEELIEYAVVEGVEDLKPGIAFASQRIPFADVVRSSHVRSIDETLRLQCLCFDFWVQNSDRKLGVFDGDSNVLWDPAMQTIALIDHDQCLDPDFDPDELKREHAFRDSRPFLEKSAFKKWRTRFESTIYNIGKIWDEIPHEWIEDESGIERLPFTLKDLEAQLIKPNFEIDGILPH